MLASSADSNLSLYDLTAPVNAGTGSCKPLMHNQWASGHRHAVTCLQWYPFDTGMFVTGSRDYSVKVWDTNTLQVAQSFALGYPVHAVNMSPCANSHQLVATATEENHIRLCDLVSGGQSHTLMGHTGPVWSLQWAPDKEYQLVTGSADHSIRLWDIRRAGAFAVLDVHNNIEPMVSKVRLGKRSRARPDTACSHYGPVTSVKFSPDGQFILSSGNDHRIRLWNRQSLRNSLVNFFSRGRKCQKGYNVAFSGDGRYVFAPVGSRIAMHEVQSGKELNVMAQGHFGEVTCVTMHPTLSQLYSGGKDTNILCWTPPDVHQPSADSAEGDDWSSDGESDGHSGVV